MLWCFLFPFVVSISIVSGIILLLYGLSKMKLPNSGKGWYDNHMSNKWIIAGDVGGTKINVACFDAEQDHLEPIRQTTYATQKFQSLGQVIGKFMEGEPGRIASVCFGVAGPVNDGRTDRVNMNWTADRREVQDYLGLPNVEIINDLVATAYGLLVLPPKSFIVINEGKPEEKANRAIIAPGTGLGESLLIYRNEGAPSTPEKKSCFLPTSRLGRRTRFLLPQHAIGNRNVILSAKAFWTRQHRKDPLRPRVG